MGGSKECPQACGRVGRVLGERITQTCMEILIRDKRIKLDEAMGVRPQQPRGKETRWSQEVEPMCLKKRGSSHRRRDQDLTSRQVGGKMQRVSGHSCCAARECAADAYFSLCSSS